MYSSHMNTMSMQQGGHHQLPPNDMSSGISGPPRISPSPQQYGMSQDYTRPPPAQFVGSQQHSQPLSSQQVTPPPSNLVPLTDVLADQTAQQQELDSKIEMIAQSQELSDFEKQAYLKSLRFFQQQQQAAALNKPTAIPRSSLTYDPNQTEPLTEINIHPSNLDQYGELIIPDLPSRVTPQIAQQAPSGGYGNVSAVMTDRAGAQNFASRNLASVPAEQEVYHYQYSKAKPQQGYYPTRSVPEQVGIQSQPENTEPTQLVEEYHTANHAMEKQAGSLPEVGKIKALTKKGQGQTDAKNSHVIGNVCKERQGKESAAFRRDPVNVIHTEHPSFVALTLEYSDEKPTPKTTIGKKKTPEKAPDNKETWQYCELCKIRFSHKKHYEVHCSGMLHVQKKNDARKIENQLAKVFDDKPETIVTPVTYKRVEQSIEKTTGLTSKMLAGGKPDDKKNMRGRAHSVESISDCELLDEPDGKPQSKASKHSCKLCNIERFNSATSFQTHVSSHQHRQKYLQKQSELGFDKFFEVFGKLQYTCSMDVTSRGSDTMSHMDLMVYRSGMLNKLECRLCGVKCGVMTSWKQHVSGKKHTRKCAEEFHSYGRETYISMYGDIPIPERARFHAFADTLEKELGNKPRKLVPGGAAASASKQPTPEKSEASQKTSESMGMVRNIPSLANTTRGQQIPSLAKSKEKQQEQVNKMTTSSSNQEVTTSKEDEEAKRLSDEKLKRIKQMDDQIKQVKEQLEAKTRMSTAVFQQHRSYVQMSGLTPSAAVMSGTMMQTPVVMLPDNLSDNQMIAMARAKAQAQGLLPQNMQMPITEQIQLLGSTVPQQISVKPTSDVAELHSQLQKQLLGAEIVPSSRPDSIAKPVELQQHLQLRQPFDIIRQQQQSHVLQQQPVRQPPAESLLQPQARQPGDIMRQLEQKGAPSHVLGQLPGQTLSQSQARPTVHTTEGRLGGTPHQVYDYGHGQNTAAEKLPEPLPRAPPGRQDSYQSVETDWKDSSKGQNYRNIKPDIKGNPISDQDHRFPRSEFDEKSQKSTTPSNIRQEWEKKQSDATSWDAPPRRQDLYKEDAPRKTNLFKEVPRKTKVTEDIRMEKRSLPKTIEKDVQQAHNKSPKRHSSRDRSLDRTDRSRNNDRKGIDSDMIQREKRSTSKNREESPDDRRKERNDEGRNRDRNRRDEGRKRERKETPERTSRKDSNQTRESSRSRKRSKERSRSQDRSRSRERLPERKREERNKEKDKKEKKTESYDKERERLYDRDHLKEIKVHTVIADGSDKRDLREVLDESRRKESLSPNDLRSHLEHKKVVEPRKPVDKRGFEQQRLPVDKSIVVEVGSSRNRESEYRKVYVPGKQEEDEDLRLQIERKQKERDDHSELKLKHEAEWKRSVEESKRENRDKDWRNSDPRHEYYKEDPYTAGKEYNSKRKQHASAGYEVVKGGGATADGAVEGRSEGKYGRGDEEYYRGYSSTHSHRDWDGYRPQGERSEKGRQQEWKQRKEEQSRPRYREEGYQGHEREYNEGAAVGHAVAIFTDTLQQFLSMLHDKGDGRGQSDKDPLAGMSREEVDAVLQVQEMTGIADISIAAKAMHVFSQMDPVMIQTIGMLGPDTIQELTSGNPDALKRIPNYEEIVDGIVKGKINPHKMQDTMERYGFSRKSRFAVDREDRRNSGYDERHSKRSYTGTEEYMSKKGRY